MPENIDMIAIRFSEADLPRGWGILDNLGVSPLVVGDGENPQNLVYMFYSIHWEKVQSTLTETGLPHQYKKGPSLSKRMIDDATTWISTPPQSISSLP